MRANYVLSGVHAEVCSFLAFRFHQFWTITIFMVSNNQAGIVFSCKRFKCSSTLRLLYVLIAAPNPVAVMNPWRKTKALPRYPVGCRHFGLCASCILLLIKRLLHAPTILNLVSSADEFAKQSADMDFIRRELSTRNFKAGK